MSGLKSDNEIVGIRTASRQMSSSPVSASQPPKVSTGLGHESRDYLQNNLTTAETPEMFWQAFIQEQWYSPRNNDENPKMHRSVSYASSCSSAASVASRNSRSGRRSHRRSRIPRRVRRASKAGVIMHTRGSSSSRSGSDKDLVLLQSLYMCECCPKKPKRFNTEDDLRLHESEKQYSCAYCPHRFKNKNEAERHQNSLHLRLHSWSCAALGGLEAAFHHSMTKNGADVCGYCGEEFANPPRWEVRAEHLNHVHRFGECNQAKKFFRADHFRQHLKHCHAGTSGKWTNMLENACMNHESLPEKRVTINGGGPATLTPLENRLIDRAHHKALDEPLLETELDSNKDTILNAGALPVDNSHERAELKEGALLPGRCLWASGLNSRPGLANGRLVTLYTTFARWCRPTPRRDHSRIEWHCCCGQQFWGDFKSDEPEKLHRLACELQHHGFAVNTTMKTTIASGTSSNTGPSTSSQNVTTCASTSSSNVSPSASTAVKKGISGTTLPAVRQTTISTPFSLQSIGKPVYLELCINRSSRVTQLGEIVIIDGMGQQLIHTDLELFASIRAKYDSIKRKGLFAILYQPSDIHYVQFGTQLSAQQTDIYQKPEALPPDTEVSENRYHYHECPLTPLPPMPPQTFYQYFRQHAPDCASRSTLFSDRLPKKLGASMTLQNGADKLEFGWGIHIIEGPNKPVLAILMATVLALSFAISVIYDVCTGNTDSGFAIGQWMVAMLSAVLSAVYFHLQGQ